MIRSVVESLLPAWAEIGAEWDGADVGCRAWTLLP